MSKPTGSARSDPTNALIARIAQHPHFKVLQHFTQTDRSNKVGYRQPLAIVSLTREGLSGRPTIPKRCMSAAISSREVRLAT